MGLISVPEEGEAWRSYAAGLRTWTSLDKEEKMRTVAAWRKVGWDKGERGDDPEPRREQGS